MKPLSLRLKGFTGIQKGMGLEEISLDLSKISGLIALSGENGSGKSSFIESLSPYRTLFSRDGSLNQHTYLRNSEKEFAFSYEGHIYKTLLKIDAESDRGEGFIWKTSAETYKEVNFEWTKDMSVVNGKRKEYDAYIDNLLGSQYLYQNSVFCPQNSHKLTDMRTGERRELFAEFLRLDKLTACEAETKQRINVRSGIISQLESRIAALRERSSKKDNLIVQVSMSEMMISDYENNKRINSDVVQHLTSECETLKETISQNAANIARKTDIQAVIDSIEKEVAEIKAQAEKELADLRGQYNTASKEVQKYAEVLKKKEQAEGAAEREKAVNQELIDLAGEEERLLKEFEVIREDVEQKEKTLAELKLAKSEFEGDKELRELEKKIIHLNNECRNCEDKIKDLDKRDPECQSATCSFIVGALIAKDGLSLRETQLQQLADEHSRRNLFIGGELEKCKKLTDSQSVLMSEKKKELIDVKRNINIVREKKAAPQSLLKELADLIKLLPEIQIAQERQEDAKKLMEELAAKGVATKVIWSDKIQEKSGQLEEHQKRLKIVNALIDPAADAKLKALQKSIEENEKAIAELDKQIKEQSDKIIGLSKEISLLAETEKEISQAEKELEWLSGEISEWTYLRNACSKTGLQALEIDGVVPLITYDANRLLSLTFGPSFSLRIETQDAGRKEVFNVWVIREDGNEVLLDNLSGEQKVWLLKALRLSMTMLSKRKSGRNFLTCYADEEDGALDVENAKTFVDLYRSFMQAGGFSDFYFISHKPECLSYADHVLKFRKGGIENE